MKSLQTADFPAFDVGRDTFLIPISKYFTLIQVCMKFQ